MLQELPQILNQRTGGWPSKGLEVTYVLHDHRVLEGPRPEGESPQWGENPRWELHPHSFVHPGMSTMAMTRTTTEGQAGVLREDFPLPHHLCTGPSTGVKESSHGCTRPLDWYLPYPSYISISVWLVLLHGKCPLNLSVTLSSILLTPCITFHQRSRNSLNLHSVLLCLRMSSEYWQNVQA